MRKWQILEFDGIPYYAFVPEEVVPIKEESIPELPEGTSFIAAEQVADDEKRANDAINGNSDIREGASNAKNPEEQNEDSSVNHRSMLEEEYVGATEDGSRSLELKNAHPGGSVQTASCETRKCPDSVVDRDGSYGDLYQVKVEAGVVTLEKLCVKAFDSIRQVIGNETRKDTDYTARKSEESLEEESQVVENFDEEKSNDDDGEIVEANERSDTSTNNGTLKCKACSETFESTLVFRKHVAWVHKKKMCIKDKGSYICSVCDYSTPKKSLFAAHLQRKHETWPLGKPEGSSTSFPCTACGFVCRSKHSLQSHFIRKHTDRYEHQCKFCSKKFKVKGDLTNHVRFHHRENPVHCDVCGKLCMNSGSLYVHQKWAHYKPKYECSVCHRRMVTQENLDQHMLMQHEKREKIVCAECGKTFTKKDSFKRHMAVHSGSKPYSCLICNKPFARRSQLRQHLLIHTGKRPFVCDICGKAFTQKPGLICHRKTHPGTHPPLPVMPIGDIVKEFTEGYTRFRPNVKEEEYNCVDRQEEEEEEEEEEEDKDDVYEEGMLEETIDEEKIE